ncbi:hypothetical protein HHL21_14590 [Massilia sp. RP-1-19]|uniref:Uncharacterized protein n=1 Tax=Massilia polaris TaxID=2728846 RepID=A0A848HM49_9BURK|nr:hypothetical protein [Massilia polaris]NML62282.1 hypothetical protein [Massilia polaris]
MFAKIVELYRALNRPPIENESFVFEGSCTPATIELIEEVAGLSDHFGYFEDKFIDGNNVKVDFRLASSDYAGRFHASVGEFIAATPSLNFGDVPERYYVIDLDYFSGDGTPPPVLISLLELCRFIRAISSLAAEYAQGTDLTYGENRLFFVLAADGKTPAKTLSIVVRIEERLLKYPLVHVRLLEVLVSEAMKNEIHIDERRMIMRLAIADALSVPDESTELFAYLVSHWRDVLSKYRHNVLAFVNQYSFEKVRKEIATAEIEHATKLSAVLGDIAGKLLALPVSLAAVLILRKASTAEEFWILFAGLWAVTVIFIGILWNQWLQVERLRSSFEIIFGQYDGSTFPKKLQAPIAQARHAIKRQYRVLKYTFGVFGFLALAPGVAALYVWGTTLPIKLSDLCVLLASGATFRP